MRILLVEDSDSDIAVYEHYLHREGHQCTVAKSIAELQTYKVADYDFAIVDLRLNGDEANNVLIAMEAFGLPYVVITGNRDPLLMRKIGMFEVGMAIKHPEDMKAIIAHAIGLAMAACKRQRHIEEAVKIFEEDHGTG